MPRSPRVVIPGHPHHVVLRGNNRRRLFSYGSDYLRFLQALASGLTQESCFMHGVVLMTNHVHLLLTPQNEAALGRTVKRASQRYAQQRNRARSASGKLFEERYYSKPVLSESQMASTVAYIELNPVRAGIVAHPHEYKWSSYHLHALDGRIECARAFESIWTPSDWYLGLAEGPDTRRARFMTWVAECYEREHGPENAAEIERLEEASDPYSQRLLRPDGSSAR